MSVCHQYVQSDRNVNEKTARADTVLNLEQVAPDFSNGLQFGLSDQKAKA